MDINITFNEHEIKILRDEVPHIITKILKLQDEKEYISKNGCAQEFSEICWHIKNLKSVIYKIRGEGE
jgi:hypothetical protein